jgi:glycosyltransferase involved in cell wall biosynthesis
MDHRPTISVVVPCYPPHQKCIPDFLKQMNGQTVRPFEIIIALSEVVPGQVVERIKEWSTQTNIPLQVVGQNEKCLAASNRNYGAMFAEGDYILFLDADDDYHAKLVEREIYYIKEYNPMAIMYHWTADKLDNTIEYAHKEIRLSECLYELCFGSYTNNEDLQVYNLRPQTMIEKIHHGHICVKQSVWAELPQQDVLGMEDSLYVRSLLLKWHNEGRNGHGVIAIPDILTTYKPNLEKQEEFAKLKAQKEEEMRKILS